MNALERIKRILSLLDSAYGKPAALRRSDPVDELVKTVLSQNTSDVNSIKAFGILKSNFKTWEELIRADARSISRMIKHAGLANIKAKRIKDILLKIKQREGAIILSSLKKMSLEDSLEYLKSLKGVGPKTAACVMLFALGKPAMPVDTHIFRVTKRLGLIGEDTRIEDAHRLLQAMVPKSLIYEFHLGIIEHGRRTCKAPTPRCGACVLYTLCRFKLKAFYKIRGAN